ncbi:non-homologous end-joining DNA ligase [Streptomyces albidus (ex Kaewkla and Franco 2022)]|uniref:non-homologous end-joining DNA ligase n=1 Tax=Streptomyces albidus (ex Kaewkla and Franco 2022) TaxID=722709 RepID=UPI0028152FCE|nr:non-homologous end-joining DNA ligase [Streptomyces albidus (ex Kaewkla and Franco 2022)]
MKDIEITRPEKVLFPDDGITKRDLADHYRRVAGRAVPLLRNRPLMMERHPDGIGGKPLMQKNAPDYFPEWVHTAELAKEDGTVRHPLCDNADTLVYLAGQACITPHRWLSRADHPHHPDLLVFDLDPSGEADFEDVRWAASCVGGLLEEVELPTQLMTTGSRGLHVIATLDRKSDFDSVRAFARRVSEVLVARHPDRLTGEARKANRGDRIYLDIQRNAYAQTAVAPYSVRALPGAPVAVPISWSELKDPKLAPDRWNVGNVEDRLRKSDPWEGPSPRGRSVRAADRRLSARL